MGEVILTMKDIDKSFPGVHALDHVNFEVKRGEVHALMGENGAGKSTLMKVLTGIYQKDSGSITYKGKETEFHNTREAQDAGVVIVHQELNMVGDLTVAQNIFIGREPKKGFSIDDKKMIEDSKKLFQELNIEINPKEKMNNLTVGKQQMCEIAKAISHKAEVIIFDEPSAALTEKEIADLFEIIRDLRKKGLGIVYISHRMDEIKTITDRVTVMRDGGYVGTLITADSTKEDIINMMVGRVIYEDPKEHSMVAPDAPVVLKVENLNAGKMVQNVSFELRKGEILGFSGLMGAGRTETARALFGADPKQSGKISIRGKDGQLREVTINSPQDAVKYGIGYLSEDRRRYGCVVQKSVTENTTLATMEEFTSGIFINKSKEKEVSDGEEWVSNSSKKWYKPWTWLQESGYYRKKYKTIKFIDGSELAREFFRPIETGLSNNGDAACKYALKQSKNIAERFNKEFTRLDEILKTKLSELFGAFFEYFRFIFIFSGCSPVIISMYLTSLGDIPFENNL